MELSVPRASISLTLFVLFVCSAEAMNYLAFPRMGRSTRVRKMDLPRNFIIPRKRDLPRTFITPRRGYLAFPRMGRAQIKSETAVNVNCCGVGLKSEFVVGQDGKEELRTVCPVNVCCEGLREIIDEKSVGVLYSMCVPDFPFQHESNARSSEVLGKLKNLME